MPSCMATGTTTCAASLQLSIAFADALAAKNVKRVFIPARSPNHNAVVERFQGTMLQECWRPAFHRLCFSSIRQLQREADAWLTTYNHRRRNHGNYMAGRRPLDLLELPHDNPNHRPPLSPQVLDRKH